MAHLEENRREGRNKDSGRSPWTVTENGNGEAEFGGDDVAKDATRQGGEA
jgi:hypothetical protein